MGALDKKRDRSIDSLWRGNDVLIKAVEAAVGIPIGSDDGVLFIQDVGNKILNRAYIDINTGRMYRCLSATSSITNDSNFKELTNRAMDKSIDYYKLEELPITVPVGFIRKNAYRIGDVVFCSICFTNSGMNSFAMTTGTKYSLSQLGLPDQDDRSPHTETVATIYHPEFQEVLGTVQILTNQINFRKLIDDVGGRNPTVCFWYKCMPRS